MNHIEPPYLYLLKLNPYIFVYANLIHSVSAHDIANINLKHEEVLVKFLKATSYPGTYKHTPYSLPSLPSPPSRGVAS